MEAAAVDRSSAPAQRLGSRGSEDRGRVEPRVAWGPADVSGGMGLHPAVRWEPASRASSAGSREGSPAPGRSAALLPGPPPEPGPTPRGRRARRPPWLVLRLPSLRRVWASRKGTWGGAAAGRAVKRGVGRSARGLPPSAASPPAPRSPSPAVLPTPPLIQTRECVFKNGIQESAESQALVQLLPKQSRQSIVEQSQSIIHQGEKPTITLETALSQKRVELKSALKSESEGKLVKQVDEIKPRPRPGDLIEIFRIGYEHWAIYMEDDCVVHLAPPTEGVGAGSITSIFSNRAVVKYSRLEDVLHGCSWKINNKLDGTYLPFPVEKIMERTRNMVNKIVQYSLIEGNCEHFVNDLRYGVPRSQQVEHVLMEGARAAGAVISAVMGGIKPKPEGALLVS
ncbi:phospholipase A and acyltransferase 5 [Perognathus longimembris pacificus]|uniref:phospholipase A and acyltransferase 5 n=1 Tax=Perognathus longimembris pacificus TaxID=214514 RepID=UPI00201A03A3|nr:phospholipase A and acyltransferase 5 [Perognathus longimembris pacificus]